MVEVGLEDVLVEDEEGFEDLEFVFVGGGLANLVVKFLVREDLLGLETLIGECFLECTCLTSDGSAREKMTDKSSGRHDCAWEEVIAVDKHV